MPEYLIVSRHPAAIDFIRAADPRFKDAPVLGHLQDTEVDGKIIAGNLPASLAAEAAEVVSITAPGYPELFEECLSRDKPLTVKQMADMGAKLFRYKVVPLPAIAELRYYPVVRFNSSGFFCRLIVVAAPIDLAPSGTILQEGDPGSHPAWADDYPCWFNADNAFLSEQECLDTWTVELGFEPELGQWRES